MQHLTGEYSHKLDAKNRIRIPAKLKKALGDEYYFAFGTDGCIFVFSQEIVDEKLTSLEQNVKLSEIEKQKGLRAFTRSLVPAEEDDYGRVVLNAALREYAGIKEEIFICGAGSRAEIWSKERHDEYFKDTATNFNDFFKVLDI